MSQTETYDKSKAKRINDLPDSELGEGGPFLDFDYPEHLTYDEYPVTKMGYTGRNILMGYEGSDMPGGWDYIQWDVNCLSDGTLVIPEDSPPVGVLTPKEVYETNPEAPHSRTLEPIYDAMYEAGVKFESLWAKQ